MSLLSVVSAISLLVCLSSFPIAMLSASLGCSDKLRFKLFNLFDIGGGGGGGMMAPKCFSPLYLLTQGWEVESS